MHRNAALVETLYGALARRDGAAMAACYAPDATFDDPVFSLRGREIGGMWSMLCSRGRDLVVTWRDVVADDEQGTAAWDARYTFAATGRPVQNRIASAFTFADGRIASQRDTFDFRRWSRMAIGPVARMPFMSPVVQKSVRRKARATLDAWMARDAARTSP
jgi:ketosteroid isomerase-like protein